MGVYNRYLPQQEGYTPVGEATGPPRTGREPFFGGGLEQIRGLLKKLLPEKLDSGDLLLLAVAFLLWREEEDNDLLLALGAALLMGDGT
jgi:hypothetical protein